MIPLLAINGSTQIIEEEEGYEDYSSETVSSKSNKFNADNDDIILETPRTPRIDEPSMDDLIEEAVSEELYFGMDQQQHLNPSSKQDFINSSMEEEEDIPDRSTIEEDITEEPNMEMKQLSLNVSEKSAPVQGFTSPKSLPNLSSLDNNSEDVISKQQKTPQKPSLANKPCRFPLPISNQPTFSPRKYRLLKNSSDYYFHPESTKCPHPHSDIITPKGLNQPLFDNGVSVKMATGKSPLEQQVVTDIYECASTETIQNWEREDTKGKRDSTTNSLSTSAVALR